MAQLVLFLVMIDVGGRIRSQTPAAQDIRVLVDSHLMMSKHVNGVCKSALLATLVGLRNIWTLTNASCCTKN